MLLRALRQPQSTPVVLPQPAIVGESPFFLVSGQLGRRRNPEPFVAARPSPAHPTPPVASSCSSGAAQHLNLDRRSPEPKAHFAPEPPSATELAAGDLLRPHLPNAHREDRLGLANPSLPSDALEEPPFVAGDRRSPAPVGQKRREGGKERSNLTSGPSGPTVSDPRSALSLFKWRRKTPSALSLLRKRTSAETFSFFSGFI